MTVNEFTSLRLQKVMKIFEKESFSKEESEEILNCITLLWSCYQDFVEDYNNSIGLFDRSNCQIAVALLTGECKKSQLSHTIKFIEYCYKKIKV